LLAYVLMSDEKPLLSLLAMGQSLYFLTGDSISVFMSIIN